MIHPDSPQRIVVGIDGSKDALSAALWAAEQAERRAADVYLLNAVNLTGAASLVSRLPLDEYRRGRTEHAEGLLDAARTEVLGHFPGLRVWTEVTPVEPVEALVAATRTAAFTVVGTRGQDGFPGLALGSVGLRTAAHCRGPLVLVPAGDGPAGGGSGGEVVLGVADREPAAVVDFAFEMAEELGVRLRAVHAWQSIPPYDGYYFIEPTILATEAESLLTAALQPARRIRPTVSVAEDAVHATAAAALLEAARGARLLVLGTHRRNGPLSIGVGRVLHAVLTHAPCPVAVVPLNERGDG
jgi:nucleotide-binding universal stress UspA family protein